MKGMGNGSSKLLRKAGEPWALRALKAAAMGLGGKIEGEAEPAKLRLVIKSTHANNLAFLRVHLNPEGHLRAIATITYAQEVSNAPEQVTGACHLSPKGTWSMTGGFTAKQLAHVSGLVEPFQKAVVAHHPNGVELLEQIERMAGKRGNDGGGGGGVLGGLKRAGGRQEGPPPRRGPDFPLRI